MQNGEMIRNPIQLMQSFNQFLKEMEGKNPEQMVHDLVESGEMTKEQYQALSRQAGQFVQMARMFGIK